MPDQHKDFAYSTVVTAMRRRIPFIVTTLVATLFAAGPYVFAQSNPSVVVMQPGVSYDSSNCVGVQIAGGIYLCGEPPTPAPTDTPTPIAPTAVVVAVTPTPTPGGVTSIAGVPLCGVPQPNGQLVGPAHDPTKWHALVERDATGAVLCTYGHDHGSDPSQLDVVFGKPVEQFGSGQQIAFPWLTGPLENGVDPTSLSHQPSDSRPVINGKHTFFKWETLTPQKLAAININGCPPNPNATYGFDNIRLEVHADANAGVDVRFHSFYVQAEECSATDATYHGQLSIGGWFDYGILNGTHQNDRDVRIPLPAIDPCQPGSTLPNGTNCAYSSSRRTHGASSAGPSGSTDPNAALAGMTRNDFTWYGHNGDPDLAGQLTGPTLQVSDGIREEDWGPVDPNNPSGPVLFYPFTQAQHHDHGWGGIDILAFSAPALNGFLSDDPPTVNPDGTYNWSGWVNVRGYIQPLVSCSTAAQLGPSTSCIPASLTNVRPGSAQFSNDVTHVPHEVEDVLINGQSLIGYPN